MYTILHAADFHLDASFASLGLPSLEARKHRENLREALVRVLELAQKKNVQAVTIGGDLYEQERFSRDNGEFLINQFEKIDPIRVFIAPGNHDPWVPDSLYQFLKWSKNVTIFQSPEFSPVSLNSQLTLWGLAHTSPSMRKNPLDGFHVPDQKTHLLLFHGSDMSHVPDGKTTHAPFQPDHLETSGAELALLGHYHRGRMGSFATKKFLYPGSPEPLSFADNDCHTVGFVKIIGSEIVVETIPVNKYQFIEGKIDISSESSREEVKNKIEEWGSKSGNPTTYLRAVLTGTLSSEIELDLEILQEKLSEHCAYGLIKNSTDPGYDLAVLAAERTVRGEFVRMMQNRIHEAEPVERAQLERALIYGLTAFEKKQIMNYNL